MNNYNLEQLSTDCDLYELESYFKRFEMTMRIKDGVTPEQITAYFLTAIGKAAFDLVRRLLFPQDPCDAKYEVIKDALLKHSIPLSSETAQRAIFHSLVRQPNQSMRNFIIQLQGQAAKCNYQEHLDYNLRDRLITGINHKQLQQQLFMLKNPTYQIVRQLVESYDDVNATTSENIQFDYPASSALFTMSSKQQTQKRPKRYFDLSLIHI